MFLQMKRKNYRIIIDYIFIFVLIIVCFCIMIILSSLFQHFIMLSESIINYILLSCFIFVIFMSLKRYFYIFPRRYVLGTNYLEIEYLFKHKKIYYKSILSIDVEKYKKNQIVFIRMAYKERVIYLNQYTNIDAFYSHREINTLLHQNQIEK